MDRTAKLLEENRYLLVHDKERESTDALFAKRPKTTIYSGITGFSPIYIVEKVLRKFGENEVGSYMSLYIFLKPPL